ncbi:MAG TPA: beta-lactamase family protein [Chloroflexi bacterium]|nr:beta-lactamase family protein [Chloroflexota bacterium]
MHTKRKHLLFFTLVVALFVAACQPVRPPESVAVREAEPATTAPQLAATYTGTLTVAGMELAITVNLSAGADGYTGAIDIPEQGASGIPLHDIRVELPSISFQMLEGPGLATFDGALAEDGTLNGVFTQAGVEGNFTLTPDATAGAATSAATAGVSDTYTDPDGRFSAPIPTNWSVTEGDGYVLFTDPERAIEMYIVVVAGDDLAQATADAWQVVDPTFAVAIDESVTPPAGNGIEAVLATSYDTGDVNRVVQAVAQLKDGAAYVILVRGDLAAFQRRNAQVAIIGSGLKILSVEETDLSGVEPLPVDDALLAALEPFITDMMTRFGVPGAVVGIVANNELVYAKGFGVADPVTGAPMQPDTHVMIGSTGKSLTTMLMGTLVDDGLMTWDTPARTLYPGFAVKDPALSEKITMRNLVCACTGVPRRDMELIFNASEQSAADTVAALADFEFYTDFGEAFQYSNQMVATAGYIAGKTAVADAPDLESAYAQALQTRVLDPIGMANTTVSFEAVTARNHYATPHTQMLDGSYQPIPLVMETLLTPVMPAGVHWSTLDDMAKYMITELQEGVAPDGQRVISAENLKETWKPQIAISNDVSYGLGWIISDYKGQPIISHDGNTMGFTSGFTFLPGRGLGVIVLTNGRGTNLFNNAVTGRFLELIFDQPAESQEQIDFYLEQLDKQVQELAAQIDAQVDADAVAAHLGRFTNAALGDINLTLTDGKLMLDAGEFATELRPKRNKQGELEGYIQMDAPLQGLVYKFAEESAGAAIIELGEGASTYTFTRAN